MIHTLLATIFLNPMSIAGWHRMLLLLPLAMSISLVYKTTKCDNLREVLPATLALWITIIIGMYAVGIALWALFLLMA